MWIEDDELREIFKTASEERLQAKNQGLLQLEQNPNNPELITAILREAHSMKGDSNMLGVKDIGTIAHEMEHILKQVQQGEREITGELCDRLSHALMAVRKMVQEAVTGEPCGVNPFHVLAELMGALSAPPEPTAPDANLTDAGMAELSGIVELTHNVTLLNPLPHQILTSPLDPPKDDRTEPVNPALVPSESVAPAPVPPAPVSPQPSPSEPIAAVPQAIPQTIPQSIPQAPPSGDRPRDSPDQPPKHLNPVSSLRCPRRGREWPHPCLWPFQTCLPLRGRLRNHQWGSQSELQD